MEPTKELAKYTAASGNDVTLTADVIRNVLTDNKDSRGNSYPITDSECMFFAALCKSYKLDPFVREAYLVKYGNKPATMIIGKDYWLKQASANQNFDGMEFGVVVITRNGELVRREGCLVGSSTERLVGGWARVHRKDRTHPSYAEVAFDEYSTGRSMWKPASQGGKPATMIAKVAKVQALREAFPECFSGLYDSSEMGLDSEPETVAAEVCEMPEPTPEYTQDVPPIEDDYYPEEVNF